MKIEVDLKKKYVLVFVGVAILLAGVSFGFALKFSDIFGHKVSEIDWSKTIDQINVKKICLNGNCVDDFKKLNTSYSDKAGYSNTAGFALDSGKLGGNLYNRYAFYQGNIMVGLPDNSCIIKGTDGNSICGYGGLSCIGVKKPNEAQISSCSDKKSCDNWNKEGLSSINNNKYVALCFAWNVSSWGF